MKTADIRTVWPQWEPVGVIGEGRYGTVTLCRGKQEGKDVYCAVKVIQVPPNASATAAAKAQGINEDMLKQYFGKLRDDLNWELSMYHPAAGGNLAPVEDCLFEESEGEPGWRAYIRSSVFTPLSVYFGKNRPTEGDAVRMGIQLLRGLEQLERFGLIHGEITTDNVMVTDAGDFVLTDFGIRRCLDKAGAGLFASSASGFDAPEVGSYNYLSGVSDLYSVGMVLASVLSGGVLPKNGNLPKCALTEILKKATAFNPADRYQTPGQMRADLEKLSVAPAAARPATAVMTAMDAVQRLRKARENGETQKEPVVVPTPSVGTERLAEDSRKRAKEENKKRRVSGLIQAACVILLFLALGAVLFVYRPWEKLGAPSTNGDRSSLAENVSHTGDQEKANDGQLSVPDANDLLQQGKGTETGDKTPSTAADPASATGTADPSGKTDIGDKTGNEPKSTDITEPVPGDNPTETQTPATTTQPASNVQMGTITGAGVRFRTQPNGKCDVIQLLNKGTEVEVHELVNNYWYHVTYGGKDGYVSKEYLKLTEGTATGTTASTDNKTNTNTTTTTTTIPTTNGYILASDSKYLTNDDLKHLTRDQTYMALNEIYARHGKIFTTKSVQEYFESQSWYKPVTKDSAYCTARFNEYEKANWNLIIQYQRDMGYRS